MNQIKKLLNGDRKTQRAVYDQYAPTMLGVCRSYFSNLTDAESVMVQGFYKVFTKIDQFKSEGSFEGWIRRIMVRECLNELRKKQTLMFVEDDTFFEIPEEDLESTEGFNAQELLDALPEGYRTVFNLFVIEGFSHQEIADELGIHINTSKSQFFKAKKKIKEKLKSKTQKITRHV